MKGFVIGAVAAISLGFAGGALAGDELMAQCAANAEAEGGDAAGMEAFCGCLVEQAGGDEAILTELLDFAKTPAEERNERFEAEATDGARAAVEACTPEEAPAQ